RRYAERTGLGSEAPSRRYLWTDAFAVCNALTLAAETGSAAWRDLALELIDAVHHELGRHREDDPRSGWISGLSESEGESHPTCGGLRIGKPLPERTPEMPFDPQLEWDRDGQYLHYLTRWMHALGRAAEACQQPRLGRWARELALTALQAFGHETPSGRRHLFWKMSIDLSRPLVPSMGHHDPLDAYLTALELTALEPTTLEAGSQTDGQTGRAEASAELGKRSLEAEIDALEPLVRDGRWATGDPLGLGGLMTDADRAFQIEVRGERRVAGLAVELTRAAQEGLRSLLHGPPWEAPADRRLPFRELGLAIGLEALGALRERCRTRSETPEWTRSEAERLLESLDALLVHRRLGMELIDFWLDPRHRQSSTWTAHEDINDVMLATAIAPSGHLDLRLDGEGHREGAGGSGSPRMEAGF
ncbi:MAG: hypothetical protein ACX98W_17190, partial [bacterium]